MAMPKFAGLRGKRESALKNLITIDRATATTVDAAGQQVALDRGNGAAVSAV